MARGRPRCPIAAARDRASGDRARPGARAGRAAQRRHRRRRPGDPLRGGRSVARGRLHRARRTPGRHRSRIAHQGRGAFRRRRREPRPWRVDRSPGHARQRGCGLSASTPTLPSRDRGLVASAWLVAKREFFEKVRSRLFFGSTGLLAILAIVVALMPVLIKMVDRGTTTTIAVSSPSDGLTDESIGILGYYLNPPKSAVPPYTFVIAPQGEDVSQAVNDGKYAGALVAQRLPTGQLTFQFLVGESIGADRIQQMQIGVFAVSIFDWINRTGGANGSYFNPTFDSASVAAGSGQAEAVGASEYAGRRIVGVVFVVLIFITLVIYGM